MGAFLILEHTPVTALGINREMHFRLDSEQEWHRLGDRLVPKDGWNPILGGRAGMLSLDVTADKTDSPGAKFNVKVQPSTRVNFGVYFLVNENYPEPKITPLTSLLKILRDRWEGAQSHAAQIANGIIDWTRR